LRRGTSVLSGQVLDEATVAAVEACNGLLALGGNCHRVFARVQGIDALWMSEDELIEVTQLDALCVELHGSSIIELRFISRLATRGSVSVASALLVVGTVIF